MATAAPNQNLPLFYKSIEPLNVTQHGTMKVRSIPATTEISKTHAIPLTVDEFTLVQRFDGDLAARRENTERDRQIESAGFLGQIGGSEVDRDAPDREVEVAVLQGGAHALAAFADFEIG